MVHRFRLQRSLVGSFGAQFSFSGVAWAGEPQKRTDPDWEAVVKGANAQGQLAIYANEAASIF
jgi:hypothetical protein